MRAYPFFLAAFSLPFVFGLFIALSPSPRARERLRVEYEENLVAYYELRLADAKLKAKGDDLKALDVKRRYLALKSLYAKGASTETTYREVELSYNLSLIEGELNDVKRAEALLSLAKLRLKIVLEGGDPPPLPPLPPDKD
jgi:hypothetical protein